MIFYHSAMVLDILHKVYTLRSISANYYTFCRGKKIPDARLLAGPGYIVYTESQPHELLIAILYIALIIHLHVDFSRHTY